MGFRGAVAGRVQGGAATPFCGGTVRTSGYTRVFQSDCKPLQPFSGRAFPLDGPVSYLLRSGPKPFVVFATGGVAANCCLRIANAHPPLRDGEVVIRETASMWPRRIGGVPVQLKFHAQIVSFVLQQSTPVLDGRWPRGRGSCPQCGAYHALVIASVAGSVLSPAQMSRGSRPPPFRRSGGCLHCEHPTLPVMWTMPVGLEPGFRLCVRNAGSKSIEFRREGSHGLPNPLE
jgi:hypothetical protein